MANRQKDFVRDRIPFLVFWVIPPAAMFMVVNVGASHTQVTLTWTVSLLVMSAGCFLNAIRSRRLHCALTGPFFLLMAASALLYGLGFIALGATGWERIGIVTLVGGLTLTFVPEWVWGKYLKR